MTPDKNQPAGSQSLFRSFVPGSLLLICAGTLLPLLAAAAFVAVQIPVFFILVLCIIAAADAYFSNKTVPELKVHLPDIIRLAKDRRGNISLLFSNPSEKAVVFRAGLAFPSSIQAETEMDVQLPPSTIHSFVEWPCLPLRRGRFELHAVRVQLRSRLGLWMIRKTLWAYSEIRVYPNLLVDRKKMAALFLNRADYGTHTRRILGQGREFEKLREYVAGDSYDQIHWKATAKRRRPITKVFQWERTQEVYVVIDCSRLSSKMSDTETALEFYLRAALILGTIAQRQGDLFGVLAFSDRVQSFVRAGNGKEHYSACRDRLYSLQPQIVSPDYEDLFSFIRLKLRRRALLVFLTDLSDPILSESFVRSASLVARLHLMVVSQIRSATSKPLFRDPDAVTVDSLYEKLSGHLQWENLNDVKSKLHKYAIQFAPVSHANLTFDVVSQYLNIKQRQQL